MSSAGGRGGFGASNTGFFFARLIPRSERKLTSDQVVEELRPKLAKIPGVRVYAQTPPSIRIGGRLTRAQYQLTLTGPDTEEMYRFAPLLEAKLRDNPMLVDVSSDLQLKNPQIDIDINRDKAASLGVTARQIEDALYTAYGSRQISTIFAPNNQYRVIMELLPEYQTDILDLSLLYVRSSSGDLVPLDSLVTMTPGLGPLTVNHSGQVPSVTLSFNLAPGVSLGPATIEVERLARTNLPATINASFQGAAQAFQSSMGGLGLLLVLAILVIYMVLGILYESFIHPLTILSAFPLAGLGALATLLIFKVDLSIYAFVGIIMLVGLVKKNGIMMIDFALEAQRKEGRSQAEAIYQGCLVRFRPIMMTAFTTICGMVPVTLSGANSIGLSYTSFGLTLIGGLTTATLLTLLVVPVFYTFFDDAQLVTGRGIRHALGAPPAGDRAEG